MRLVISAGLVLALFLATTPAQPGCLGLDYTRTNTPKWITYSFYHSKEPALVTFSIQGLSRATRVEYYTSVAWVPITHDGTVEGTRIRINPGGSSTISYRYQDCVDILEPEDK